MVGTYVCPLGSGARLGGRRPVSAPPTRHQYEAGESQTGTVVARPLLLRQRPSAPDDSELCLYSSLPPRPSFSTACSSVSGPRSSKFSKLPWRGAEGAVAASAELLERQSSASNANEHLANDLRRTLDLPPEPQSFAPREGNSVDVLVQDTTSFPRRLPKPPQEYLREYQLRQEAQCELQNAKVAHWESSLLFRHLQRMAEANEWSEELGLSTRYKSHKTPDEEVVCHIYEDGAYSKQVSLEFFERRYKALQSRYKHLAATRDIRAASTSNPRFGGVCSVKDVGRAVDESGAGSHLDMPPEKQIIITMTLSSASQMNDEWLREKTLEDAFAAKGFSADEMKTSWQLSSRTIKDKHGNCHHPHYKHEYFHSLDFPLQIKYVFRRKASRPEKSCAVQLSQEDQDQLQQRIRHATLEALAMADGLRQQLDFLGGRAPGASSLRNTLTVH